MGEQMGIFNREMEAQEKNWNSKIEIHDILNEKFTRLSSRLNVSE